MSKNKAKTFFQRWFDCGLKLNNLSKADVAKKLHTTPATISRIYNHHFEIKFMHIVGFCYVFGCDDPEVVWKLINEEAE